MKRNWWRRLAQRLAYPKSWPTCISYWNPIEGEDQDFPPWINISVNGRMKWYRVVLEGEGQKSARLSR